MKFYSTFKINLKVKQKKFAKRKVYNYSKANWRGLNYAIRQMNWNHLIGSQDPHTAWPCFKSTLTDFCNRYIPKKSVKCQFQPPWYDSDCDKVYREKEKWRIKFKTSNNESDHKKFHQLRKDFKNIMNEKLRLSVEDDSDPSLISKNFWSHVKSKSKSTRIPETISYAPMVTVIGIIHLIKQICSMIISSNNFLVLVRII